MFFEKDIVFFENGFVYIAYEAVIHPVKVLLIPNRSELSKSI